MEAIAMTGSLTGTRWQHTATLLNDGSVLIAGGFGFNTQNNGNALLATADRYFSTAPLSPIAFTTYQGIAPGTAVSSNSTAFNGTANSLTPVGFNGILNGAPFLSFNPLVVSGVNFSSPNAAVNVTKNDNYPSNVYPVDFIVDSANSNPTNSVTIILPQPVTALGIDYGGLGPAFQSVPAPISGTISLSNGFVLPLSTLPTVGITQFSGFVSSTPFTSLTYTVNNDHWIVTERFDIFVLLRTHGTMKAVPLRKAHPDVLTPGILIVAPAFHPGGRAGTDPDQIHRTMADVVISVTEEVLGTELPIRWGGPLLNPTEDFGPPFATIAAIEHVVEMCPCIAEVVLK